MTTEDPKRWSLVKNNGVVTGLFSKQIYWTLVWAEKLSVRNNELIHVVLGVANGTTKNVGLGKFWQDLEISEAFLISLEVSFLHGLFLLFLSLETFYQRVSGSDF